ncbi:MAG: carboxymuconolactone decarboxylase family protein [Rhodospirillales bacterium]|nr:carboxymuconolactone decarboxylase family protein [Rhodospirillales bacterium]
MAITPKEKELAAVGISVAAGCKPCTDHHVTVARKARATDLEIEKAVAVALAVRRTAAEIMEAHASAQLGGVQAEAQAEAAPSLAGATGRLTTMVSVGAAFAVNCVSSLERQLAAAEAAGLAADEIMQVVKLAAFIKRRAASHVERLAGLAKDEAA